MTRKRSAARAAVLVGVVALGAAAATSVVLTASADPPKEGFQPDPPVHLSTKHWVFQIDVRSGVVSLGRAHSAETAKPEGTPRVLGRYALELYSGFELLDRVRFNVPGLGDGPHDDHRALKRPAMDRVTTHFSIRIADDPRTNWARVVDRATGDEVYISWPPDEVATPAPTASASASAAEPTASAPASGASPPPSSAPSAKPAPSSKPAAAPSAKPH